MKLRSTIVTGAVAALPGHRGTLAEVEARLAKHLTTDSRWVENALTLAVIAGKLVQEGDEFVFPGRGRTR